MKKIYFLSILCLLMVFSCKDDDLIEGTQAPQGSIVNFDINAVPYNKLSTYSFFSGNLKDLTPSRKVIPYEPASSLFTDYALKKRFVWMPEGARASYDADDKTLNFPVGTVLIKNFYYNTIQPNNTSKIIETRLMIRKSSGWVFAEYLWNNEQTEATLVSGDGSSEMVTFKKPNNEIVAVEYRIPSESECLACHKFDNQPIPIGVKPQNLNVNYTYPNGVKNQLQKLVDEGYLASYPSNIVSTVDYTDTSKPVDIRMRSYLDINCAHCHQEKARCDYTAVRFSFNKTSIPQNLGVCVTANEPVGSLEKIIFPGNHNKSIMNFRLVSVDESNRMPLFGRTIVHDEGVALVQQYINSLNQICN